MKALPAVLAIVAVLYFSFNNYFTSFLTPRTALENQERLREPPALPLGRNSEEGELSTRHKESIQRAKKSQADRESKLRWLFFKDFFPFMMRWEYGDPNALQKVLKKFPPPNSFGNYNDVWSGKRKTEMGFDFGKLKKKEKICHWDKNDPGGFTTLGVAYKRNEKWYMDIFESTGHKCTKATKEKLVCDGKNQLKNPNICPIITAYFSEQSGRRVLSDWYWTHYGKRFFMNCSFTAAFFMSDSAVTSGPGNAIRIFQRSHGLKDDGIMGKLTKMACKKFMPKSYAQAEIKRYEAVNANFCRKKLKSCDRFIGGWKNRVNDKLKQLDAKK